MELSGMLVWAAVLVSLIVFIILLVKSFKNWGVGMTIGFVILFIECWVFLIFTAGVNDYRLKAVKDFDTAYNLNLKLKDEKDLELYGPATDPAFDKRRFVALSQELNRVLQERGRTWRGARVIDASSPARIIVQLPTAASTSEDGSEPQAPVQRTDPLSVDSVIYAFGEDGERIPRAYLGEFKVTTVAPNGLTLVPTAPLAPNQVNNLNAGSTWAIYEKIPIDSNTAFAEPGSQPSEDEIFGHMNPDSISKLLNIPLDLANLEITPSTDINQAIKARVLRSYLNDGTEAPEGTDLQNILYEVTFLKDYTVPVDSNLGRASIEGGFFDASGKSIDNRLMAGGEGTVTIPTDQKIRMYGPRAKELERDGTVKLGRAFFVRPLNDYDMSFRETRRLTLQVQQDIALVQREIALITKSDEDAKRQQLKLAEDQTKLEADKSQYDKEISVLNAEVMTVSDLVKAKKQELSQVYSQIRQAYNALLQAQSNNVPVSALDAVTSR